MRFCWFKDVAKHVHFPLNSVEVDTADKGDRWDKDGLYLYSSTERFPNFGPKELVVHLAREDVEAIIRTWNEFCGDNDESTYITMLYEPAKRLTSAQAE